MNQMPILATLLAAPLVWGATATEAGPHDPHADVLPAATRLLVVPGTAAEQPTLLDLLREFGDCTGQKILMDEPAQGFLGAARVPLLAGSQVPAAEVYSFVESILAHHSIYIAPVKGGEVPMLGIYPTALQGRNGGGARASIPWTVVSVEELEEFVDHPALFIQTVVDLAYLDARQVSTSMRMLYSDQNVSLSIPTGSGSLVLRGSGRQVYQTVQFLRLADAAEGKRVEAEREAAKTRPGPGGQTRQG